MIPGIDLSHHNGPGAVPWRTAKFAFVRATFGSKGLDTATTEHLSRGLQAGCPVLGAYHYLKADSPGGDQAAHFLSRVLQLEGLAGPLALAVDVEDMPPPHPPWDASIYTSRLLAFLDVLERAGRVCAVYIAPWQAAKMGLDARVGRCPLWLAHWVSIPKVPNPPWSDWAIWQYAVEGGIDRNRYRGSVADLRALFRLDSPLSFDVLAPVVTEIRAAEGRGPGGVEDFTSRPEGPVIDGR